MNLGSSELIIVLVIVLLVFGGSQLPKLAKNLGKAQKEFKEGLADGAKDDDAKDGADADDKS
jgi:sec-independent protein translocase protein TatA